MKRWLLLVAAGLTLATAGSAAATPTPPHRVVVAGPAEAPIAKRVQQELVALGFEAIRVGDLENCARAAVIAAATENAAVAAACADGDQVGIWVTERGTLRLRDVVVAHDEGERARETTAVRAAEITRTAIAMLGEDAAREEPQPLAKLPIGLGQPTSDLDKAKEFPRRAPSLLGSVGVSTLMGDDARVAAISTQFEIGVLRNMTAAARFDYPLAKADVGGKGALRVGPAFAGAGVNFPLAGPSAFLIPRVGGGLGLVWLNASRDATQTFAPGGELAAARGAGSDSVASPAGFANAGVSMRVYQALRFTVDATLGATTNRLVVRDQGVHVASWGQPFGALAGRAELLFP